MVLTPTLILLAWQVQVSDFMPDPALPLLTVLITTFWSCWLYRLWVLIPCQIQLCPLSGLPHTHSGTVGFTVCEWFHGRSSHASSHCPHSNSGAVHLTGCKWFHTRVQLCPFSLSPFLLWSCWLNGSMWVIPWLQICPFQCSNSCSGPVWLTASESWLHDRSSYVPSHYSYSHLGSWLDSKWVIPCPDSAAALLTAALTPTLILLT